MRCRRSHRAYADLRRTLDEMESTLEVASAQCPRCGEVNLFSGSTQMLAYTARIAAIGIGG